MPDHHPLIHLPKPFGNILWLMLIRPSDGQRLAYEGIEINEHDDNFVLTPEVVRSICADLLNDYYRSLKDCQEIISSCDIYTSWHPLININDANHRQAPQPLHFKITDPGLLMVLRATLNAHLTETKEKLAR
jgi:hypothetical protein